MVWLKKYGASGTDWVRNGVPINKRAAGCLKHRERGDETYWEEDTNNVVPKGGHMGRGRQHEEHGR